MLHSQLYFVNEKSTIDLLQRCFLEIGQVSAGSKLQPQKVHRPENKTGTARYTTTSMSSTRILKIRNQTESSLKFRFKTVIKIFDTFSVCKQFEDLSRRIHFKNNALETTFFFSFFYGTFIRLGGLLGQELGLGLGPGLDIYFIS